MQINPMYYNQEIINFKNKTECIQKKDKSNKNIGVHNKIVHYAAIGTIGILAIIALKRTTKNRIEKIAHEVIIDEQIKERKYLFKRFRFETFTNNNSVASIDELAGLEELKTFINKYQTFSNNKSIMLEHNVEPFASILLWGVPGTGKTSAAMGIAKKLDADFIRLDKELFDSEFISKGPRQLAEYFRNIKEQAQKNPEKKIVVFMDEIDSTISIDMGKEAKQDDVLINTLKQGIVDLQQECKNVIFIGATNKDPNGLKSDNTAVRLNTAILSRFNYQFELDLPQPKDIKEAWNKLIKTQSGKEKFTDKQNEIIAQKFHKLGMSYRDIKNISNKLNIDDAVEFCKKGSYNSKKNLIDVLKNDEKIGYNHITKTNMDNNKKLQIIKELEKEL
ncbi:TPA: hypothetical protein CPT88_05720 [Candidatus Gastranaerophilales bacterium HUM_8]|nr:MAG TPA: hypothetical protein CPT88_05720 [Candidatus Gastranaerophilales bacterium HUM_8]DAA99441.1 MAG TPA: hypothetical protein CPT89_10060 [Candidatus Gastranaerophilales bacterium HUM_11]